MISEADAREAARHLAVCRERLSKLDKEDVEFKFIARDMDNHAWRLACFAVDELARRDWQDEPSTEGWHWVDDFCAPQRVVQDRNGKWCIVGGDGRLYTLFGRVCKITERPA